jgi:hypothetical protein
VFWIFIDDLRRVSLIILQQNSDTVKAESDVDVVSAEQPVGMEAAEVHLPSAFPIKIPEPKVSLFFFGGGLVHYMHMYRMIKKSVCT